MPDLNFEVERAEPLPFAASPQLVFKLRVTDASAGGPTPIPAVALRCQIRIEPTCGAMLSRNKIALLTSLPSLPRWGQTLRTALDAHGAVVPPFTGQTVVDLPVQCSFDFNVAATKYFHGLEDGEVPLCLLFSGSIFYSEEDGGLQVSPIPWEKEADFRLPVKVWKEMIDIYYPNSAWLCLDRDVFAELYRYKSRLGLPTWEQVLERLLDASGEGVEP